MFSPIQRTIIFLPIRSGCTQLLIRIVCGGQLDVQKVIT